MAFELKEGLIKDLSSEMYHSIPNVFSSSQVKDGLVSQELFYDKYISKVIERESIPAFDIGTYFHTAILEPEKLESECAVYMGKRIGKNWEDFKAKNAGKAIITESEYADAMNLVRAVQASPVAMGRLSRGEPEVSGFLKLRVFQREIYAITWGKVLGKYGWEDAKVPAKGFDLWVKVRADLLADSFVLDLKSTQGDAKDADEVQKTVANYKYDLSAAMYLDVFSAIKQRTITDFIWTFASKKFKNCRSYVASAKSIQVGRKKFKIAILNIVDGFETDWSFEDYIGTVEPVIWDLHYIKDKEEDLL